MLKEDALEIKKYLNNDEFLTFTHPKDGWKTGKYRMALEKKEEMMKPGKYREKQYMHRWKDSGS